MRSFVVITDRIRGKARPRTVTGAGGRSITYTTKEDKDWEELVRWSYVRSNSGQAAYEGAFGIRIECTYAVPESFSKRQRMLALSGELTPTGKPDLDNIAKGILDALNGIAFEDDAKCVELHVSKKYGGATGVTVEIWRDDSGMHNSKCTMHNAQ